MASHANRSIRHRRPGAGPSTGVPPAAELFEPATPNAEPVPEERAGVFSSLTYWWVGAIISVAAGGKLPRGIVSPLARGDKTSGLARTLGLALAAEQEKAETWNKYVVDGTEDGGPRPAGEDVRLISDPNSRGTLRWVGYTQQRHPSKLKVAVEWRVLPAAGHRGSAYTGGMVDGERLFTAPSGKATLEKPRDVRFVAFPSDWASELDAQESAGCCGTSKPVGLMPPRSPSLSRALFPIATLLLWSAVPRMAYEVCYLAGPQILTQFIRFISHSDSPWWQGALVAAAYFVAQLGQTTGFQKCFHYSMRAGLLVRSALMAQIFRKALTLSPQAAAHPELSAGRVVNMMSGDVERLNTVCGFIMYLVTMPVQIVITMAMLVNLVGWIAFVPVVLTLFISPIQGSIMKRTMATRAKMMGATDRRVKAVNELFTSVRVLKFMGWEPRFIEKVAELRDVEMALLQRIQYYRVALDLIMSMAPTIIMASVFVLLGVTGHVFDAQTIFPTIALLNILSFPFTMLPMVFNMLMMTLVSIRRLERFFNAEDADDVLRCLSEYEGAAEDSDGTGGTALEAEAAEEIDEDYCRKGRTIAAVIAGADVAAFEAVELPKRPKAPSRVQRIKSVFQRKKRPATQELPADAGTVAAGESETTQPATLAGTEQSRTNKTSGDTASKNGGEKPASTKPKPGGKPSSAGDDKFYRMQPKRLLHDVSMEVNHGKLTVVIGPTGCGKSVLLESLLGVLKLEGGAVFARRGGMALVPQQPWVMNATVRENVLFFEDFDEARYDLAISTSQLKVDLKELPDGDETELGERGVTLSGGQRARVALARAIYADKDLYLLDDPLAAVDAHVGQKLVDDCICGPGLRGKTRILATHQLHIVPRADRVVVMDSGKIAFTGTPSEFDSWSVAAVKSPLLGEGMSRFLSHDDAISGGQQGAAEKKGDGEDDDEAAAENALIIDGDPADEKKRDGEKDGTRPKASGMSEEERATGSVPMGTYKRYLQACGGVSRGFMILSIYFVTELFNAGNRIWLSVWTQRSIATLTNTQYLYIFVAIVVVGSLGSGIRAYAIYQTGLHGSRKLHRNMVRSVAAAPMSFFDTTPLGRILNRFAKDIDTCDNELPMMMMSMLQLVFSIFSSMTIMVASQPFVLPMVVVVAIVYYRILIFYNASNREIKRVDSINKSPVFALLSEALEGAKTIAAFEKAPHVLREAVHRIDAVFSTSYLQQACNRWLGLRLDFLGNCIITTIATAGVITHCFKFGVKDVGLISLGMTLASGVTMQLNWLIRSSASVEAGMNSVERILHYTNGLPAEDFSWYGDRRTPEDEAAVQRGLAALQEAPESDTVAVGVINADAADPLLRHASPAPVVVPVPPAHNPLPLVPLAGYLPTGSTSAVPVDDSPASPSAPRAATDLSLEFRDVQLRYRPGLPLVLDGVSFKVAPRHKVGLVGRTGSGKSTTMLAMLRIVPVAGGGVYIGGVKSTDLALGHLRSLFAMIPQVPVLFDGTVRSNLDPFDEHDDQTLTRVIEQVGILERVDKEGGASKCPVTESGRNFSVGQRQLLCMARALLMKSTGFILMDEATANVDREADRLIQRTIRTAFADRTVITIAHRLNTVLDNDQIVVLDKGRVAEVGSPAELAGRPDGALRSMIAATGPSQERRLLDIAFGRAGTTQSPAAQS